MRVSFGVSEESGVQLVVWAVWCFRSEVVAVPQVEEGACDSRGDSTVAPRGTELGGGRL